ncbi:hypothetical protein Tco_0203510, partial [Tanacetum coccineum]
MFANNMGTLLIPSSLFEDPRYAVDFTKAKQTKAGEVRGHSDKVSSRWPNSMRNDSNSYASALKGQAQPIAEAIS